MTILRTTCRVRIVVAVTLLTVLTAAALAAPVGAERSVLTTAQPSALLTIDQNRTTVVDRIVGEWGAMLSRSSAGISSTQLHTLLMGLRADHLLAASLAGSLPGLRDVLAHSLSSTTAVKSPRLHAMALGDTTDDLVYTPVSPCRLFDTRPAQGGLGVMTPNVRRTYGAITPVANQGGPGACAAGTGAAAALIQIGTLTPSGNGYLQGGAQGVGSFPNALILYQPGDQYGTAVAMPLNAANGQFDLQVQFASTDLYGDLLGYFKRAVNTSTGAFEVAVGGNLALQIQPDATSPILIAGSSANTVTAGASGAAIGGGGAPGTTIVGQNCGASCANRVTDAFGTIGGGAGNQAGDAAGTAVDAPFATVGGGLGNTASGFFSTVGGGDSNSAGGIYATVAGGALNDAGGGLATVAGGYGNSAGAFYATVAGGSTNTAGAIYATVAGGSKNSASGLLSFAAGRDAHAGNNGCFVWGDSNSINGGINCIAADQVAMRAFGGFLFATGLSGGLYVGAYLPPGSGSWGSFSDRNGKERFQPVDARAVLRKLAAMPISTWNWKSQDATIRHMGPMAQDFSAAFGLGEDDKHISTVDADGVALAAIQGLHQLMQDKERKIARLERELNAIKTKLGLN